MVRRLEKRVARPRIEDGEQHHFIFQRRPGGRCDGFKRLQRIGHDPGANDDLLCGAHEPTRSRKGAKSKLQRAALRKAQVSMPLQVIWFKAGVFGNAHKHLWADFFAVMEGKHHIRPAVPRKNSM
jgi:hypothetical protein